MTAGIVPAGAQQAAQTALDCNVPGACVSLKTATFLEFNRWAFTWQMAFVIEVFFIGLIIFLMRPFIPFVWSKLWAHTPILGIMTKVRNIVPIGGCTLRNGMYRKELKNNVMYFIKRYFGSYFFMGVPMDIVHIDRGFVQDPIYNKYLQSLVQMGYKDVTAINNAMMFNGIDSTNPDSLAIINRLGFDTYESAHAALNPASIIPTTKIYAPRFSTVPMDKLHGFGADITPGSIAAQVSDMLDFRMPPAEKDRLMELMPMIMVIITMAIAGAIVISQVK